MPNMEFYTASYLIFLLELMLNPTLLLFIVAIWCCTLAYPPSFYLCNLVLYFSLFLLTMLYLYKIFIIFMIIYKLSFCFCHICFNLRITLRRAFNKLMTFAQCLQHLWTTLNMVVSHLASKLSWQSIYISIKFIVASYQDVLK